MLAAVAGGLAGLPNGGQGVIVAAGAFWTFVHAGRTPVAAWAGRGIAAFVAASGVGSGVATALFWGGTEDVGPAVRLMEQWLPEALPWSAVACQPGRPRGSG
jgi:hypothetical protein